MREEIEKYKTVERAKENEVRTAYQALRTAKNKGEPSIAFPTELKRYDLYCADHVEFCPERQYSSRFVDFSHPWESDLGESDLGESEEECRETENICGHLHLGPDSSVEFDPFPRPKEANAKKIQLSCHDGEYQVSVRFIGDDYVTLLVSRDLVFINQARCPLNAPEVFAYVGISHEKEVAETQRYHEESKTRQPPSPRDTFWMRTNGELL